MTKTITKLLLNWETYQIKEYNPRITLFDGSSIAQWAWIFHNPEEWVISISSDGTNRITIADKNLWATTVYNDWDNLSESNCGWYFQRWNNYMFHWTWNTTSSTLVDTTGYWPWNYYNDSTFITTIEVDWSTVDNNDLWWDTTNTLIARQWPCDSWYHVPTESESTALVNAMTTLGIDTSNGDCVKAYLKMPFAGYCSSTEAEAFHVGVAGHLWESSEWGAGMSRRRRCDSSSLSTQYRTGRAFGMPVRPFKNNPIHP